MNNEGMNFPSAANRIVSLVPSITESVCRLGMAKNLVGATDYCVRPAAPLENVKRVGGPKNPSIDSIVALKPDVVLASDEENSREDMMALMEAGVEVRVARVRSVANALRMLDYLAVLSPESEKAARYVAQVRNACADVRKAASPGGVRTACLVWRYGDEEAKAYKTCNKDTYISDLIATMGGRNVFANAGEQYPTITPDDLEKKQPDLILLPTDPFYFRRRDVRELGETMNCPAARNRNIRIVNGRLLVWYGTALLDGLKTLAPLFRR